MHERRMLLFMFWITHFPDMQLGVVRCHPMPMDAVVYCGTVREWDGERAEIEGTVRYVCRAGPDSRGAAGRPPNVRMMSGEGPAQANPAME